MERSKYNINYEEYITFGNPTGSCFADRIELERFARKGKVFATGEIAEDFKRYYDLMMNEEYFYVKTDLMEKLDFKNNFIQKFIKQDFNLLLLSRNARDVLKCATYIKRKNIELVDEDQEEIYKLALKLADKINFKNKIFYKKAEIIEWIGKNFRREAGKELKEIDYKEALEIFEKSIVRNKTIKEIYYLKHDMQVTRLIKNKLFYGAFRKYVFFNAGETKPVIRYLVDEEIKRK